jgi:hypothetical protein
LDERRFETKELTLLLKPKVGAWLNPQAFPIVSA